MTQEQVEELVRTILLEKRGWAERLPVIREEMGRLSISQFDLTIWLRERGIRTGRGPVSNDTVGRWLRGTAPDADAQDAIVDMLVAASLGNWSKGRFLSWHRVADAIRPIRPPRILRRLALLPVAAVLLALVPMPAQAQTAIDWGPGGTAYGAMTPPWTSPVIHVVDSLAGTLKPERRRVWIQARNQALANWTPGGVAFQVERVDGLPCDGVSNAVQMCKGLGDDTYWPLTDGAIVSVHPWAPWWEDYYFSQLVGTIGHEVGHTLGFGHGGNGIMGGGSERPNAVELEALHAYWG